MQINRQMIRHFNYINTFERRNYFNNETRKLLPKYNIKRDNCIKYILNFHGGKNDDDSTFQIPKNFYIISLEKKGIITNSSILEFLLFKMGLQNNFSNIFFKCMTEEMFYTENCILYNRNIEENIEEKYFKVYNNEYFYDYVLHTDELNTFYTGLFKCPIKPTCIIGGKKLNTKNIIKLFNDNSIDYDSYETRCVLNPFKFTNVKLFFKSEYYTLHCNYLNRLKRDLESHDINPIKLSKMKCLKKSSKNIKLSEVVTFLCNKRNEKMSKTPIILILSTCTKLDTNEYYQDNLMDINNTYFDYEKYDNFINTRNNRNNANSINMFNNYNRFESNNNNRVKKKSSTNSN
jgi:hypothetical protein